MSINWKRRQDPVRELQRFRASMTLLSNAMICAAMASQQRQYKAMQAPILSKDEDEDFGGLFAGIDRGVAEPLTMKSIEDMSIAMAKAASAPPMPLVMSPATHKAMTELLSKPAPALSIGHAVDPDTGIYRPNDDVSIKIHASPLVEEGKMYIAKSRARVPLFDHQVDAVAYGFSILDDKDKDDAD